MSPLGHTPIENHFRSWMCMVHVMVELSALSFHTMVSPDSLSNITIWEADCRDRKGKREAGHSE
jgi:hypothetical protein